MTAPMNSPAMSPEQQGMGGEQDEHTQAEADHADVGLAGEAVVEGQQVLGTCSPERHLDASQVFLRLHAVQDASITSTEKEAVERCLRAIRELLGVAE